MISGVVSPLLASLLVISFAFALSPFGFSFLVNLFAVFIFNLYNFFAQFSELVISLLILDACFSSMSLFDRADRVSLGARSLLHSFVLTFSIFIEGSSSF